MAIFDEKIEIRERCKGVHCVDLGESFQTHILLQKLASIQPRTSPVKFAPRAEKLFNFGWVERGPRDAGGVGRRGAGRERRGAGGAVAVAEPAAGRVAAKDTNEQ